MAEEAAQEKALGNRRRGHGKKPLEPGKKLPAHPARELQVIVRQARSHISGIPAEKLVRPLAGKQDLGAVLPRELADQEAVDNGGISERFL